MTGRRVSPDGRRTIAREEGVVLHRYADSLGYGTICVGHLIRPGEAFAATMTREACDDLLTSDLAPIEVAIFAAELTRTSAGHAPLTQEQVDALASFLVNVGTGGIGPATGVGRALREGRDADVPTAMLAWSKGRDSAGGPLVVRPYLLARRKREGEAYAAATLPDVVAPALDAAEVAYLTAMLDLAALRLDPELPAIGWHGRGGDDGNVA